MELFSEIYGCYFTVVSRILEQSQEGLGKAEIEKLVKSNGFYDSTFHLLPSLFSGEWNLLYEKDKTYYSRLSGNIKRPLSILEKAWLKALLDDSRIKLFLDATTLAELKTILGDVEPLFCQEDFHIYDRHLDGDDFEDTGYIERFRMILQAVKERIPLIIEYNTGKGGRTKRQYYPYKICYSSRDNKFRLQCAAFHKDKKRFQRLTLNLTRIVSIQVLEAPFPEPPFLEAPLSERLCTQPVILEISRERNALERCMLQFASFERQTEYDRERDIYTCRIWFASEDETELLIRILSFGPVVKVLGPESFLIQMKERIGRQMSMLIKS